MRLLRRLRRRHGRHWLQMCLQPFLVEGVYETMGQLRNSE